MSLWHPRPQRPANFCATCGDDFGSVSAFDAHRVGVHGYTFTEGLKLDPPVEDGRRCLSSEEMRDKGWKQDSYDRWRTPLRAGASFPRRVTTLRPSEESEEVAAA